MTVKETNKTNTPTANRHYGWLKRTSDVALSVAALVGLSPFLLAIGVAVKLTSKGPVIYSQERIGKNGKPFVIYKFRTMHNHAEPEHPQLSHDHDPRVTGIGEFLRKYRLDELPQLWNIIKGDMAIVGPRPEREYFIRQILEQAPEYSALLSVRPGLTSLGMVKYGYATSVDAMVERMKYDLEYLDDLSLGEDLKIMLYTVKTVVTGKGI